MQKRSRRRLLLATLLGLAALVALSATLWFRHPARLPTRSNSQVLGDGTTQGSVFTYDSNGRLTSAKAAEITKHDCERLVSGQLLFQPSRTMRQGQPYTVFARLTRAPGVDIAEGLVGYDFAIVTEKVSCKVSLNLDSEEPAAFLIEKIPDGRKDEQVLEPNSFSQWDWRVTPKKSGTLHLLLFVTPMLYVDGIGEQLKQFPQPPEVITVSPDYLYASKAFVKDDWPLLSSLFTVIVLPLCLWFRTGIVSWFTRHFAKDKASQI